MNPRELLDALGASVAPNAPRDSLVAEIPSGSLSLRRDCHGVLRRLEFRFASEERTALEARLEVSAWRVVVPGSLQIADIEGVGRLLLLTESMNLTLRLSPDPERLRALVMRALDFPLSLDRPPSIFRVDVESISPEVAIALLDRVKETYPGARGSFVIARLSLRTGLDLRAVRVDSLDARGAVKLWQAIRQVCDIEP